MADEQLRLPVAVVDQFSGPLRAFRQQLATIGPGPGVGKLKAELAEVTRVANDLRAGIERGLQPALNAIGVSSLTVGGALAGIAATVRIFSASTSELARFSAATGVAINAVRTWQEVGSRLGIPAEQMRSSLGAFSEQFRDLQKGFGNLFNWGMGQNSEIQALFLRMRQAKDAATAFGEAVEFMEKNIPNPAERRKFAEAVFGNGDFAILGARLLGKPIKDLIAEAERDLGRLPESAVKNAIAFEEALDKMSASLRGLRDAVGGELLNSLRPMIDQLRQWVDLNQGEIKTAVVDSIKSAAEWLKGQDWKTIGADLVTMFGNLKEIAGGVADAFRVVKQAVDEVQAAIEKVLQWSDRAGKALNGGDVKDITPEERQRLIDEQKRQPPKSFFDRMRGFAPISYGGGGDAAYGSPFEMFRDAVRDGVLEALREFVAGGPGGAGGIQRAGLGWSGGSGGGPPEMSGGSRYSGGWRRGGPGGGTGGDSSEPQAPDEPRGPAPGTTPGSGGTSRSGAPIPPPRPSGLTPGSGVPRIRRSDLSPGQQRSVEATQNISGAIDGLNLAQTREYARRLGLRESTNRYNTRNSLGFSGRWQMGAAALADTGYVRKGTSNWGLNNSRNWLGKNDVNSLAEFLNNKGGVQDKQFLEYTNRNAAALRRRGIIADGMDPDKVAGFLAAAHLGGPGGAAKLARGLASTDAYGSSTASYFRMMRGVRNARDDEQPAGSRGTYTGLSKLSDEDAASSGTDGRSFPKEWRKAVDGLAETKTLPKRAAEVSGDRGQSPTGSVNITLDGFPKGMRARTSMDGLFKDVTVNRPRAMPDADEGN